MYAAAFEPERLVPLSKGLVGPLGRYVAGRRHFDAMKKKGGDSALIRSFAPTVGARTNFGPLRSKSGRQFQMQ
jgi:hypothetical protein